MPDRSGYLASSKARAALKLAMSAAAHVIAPTRLAASMASSCDLSIVRDTRNAVFVNVNDTAIGVEGKGGGSPWGGPHRSGCSSIRAFTPVLDGLWAPPRMSREQQNERAPARVGLWAEAPCAL